MLHKIQAGILIVAVMALVSVAARAEGLVVTTLAGTAGTTGTTDGSGAGALFNGPSGVATDGSGNVFVADTHNHTIRKVTAAGVVTTFAGTAGTSGSKDGTGITAQFNFPEGVAVAVDASGNLLVYVADTQNNTIRKITSNGTVSTLAGSAGTSGGKDGTGAQASFSGPSSVAVDANGNVFVADTFNNTIRMVTSAGVVTTLAGTAGSSGSTDATGSAARFNAPSGVAVDKNGNVYIADKGNQTIRMITPAGVVSTPAGSAGSASGANGTGSQARFSSPAAVAVDGNLNVYVADSANDTIRKITSAGVVTTIAGVAPGGGATSSGSADGTGFTARFNGPLGVAVDSSGNVFVADTGNSTIRQGVPGAPDAMRIELDWDVPTDLDLYVKEPTGNIVNYSNPSSTTGGTWLTDVTNGTGPEILAWTILPGGTFEYWAVYFRGDQTSAPPTVNYTITVYQNGNVVAVQTGTLTATPGGTKPESQHSEISVLGPNSGAAGVQNVATGTTVTNPLNGFGITVAASNGGVVELSIDLSGFHAAFDVRTGFQGISQSLGTVSGYSPAWKFSDSSVYVAKATAFDAGTQNSRGKARRTLAVAQKEIDGTTNFAAPPSSNSITPKGFKAKLSLPSLVQSAAANTAKNNDSVTFTGEIELPVGLQLPAAKSADTLDLALGIGNIIDHVAVDSRGNTKSTGDAGNIKKVSVKLPRPDKTTGLTFGTVKQRTARVTVTLSNTGFVANGFDTEGVSATPASSSLKIQVAFVLAGVTYQSTVTAGIKVTKKQDFASLTQARVQ